jgi:hypothetical protein
VPQPLADVGIDAVDGAAAAQARPLRVRDLYGSALTLYPTPDGVYSLELRYERDSATLVGDGDLLPLDDAYADLPVVLRESAAVRARGRRRAGRLLADTVRHGAAAAARRHGPPTVAAAPAASMWDDLTPGPRFQRP